MSFTPTPGSVADRAVKALGYRAAPNGILEVRRETVGGAAELVLFSADEVRYLVRHLVRYLERMAESGA